MKSLIKESGSGDKCSNFVTHGQKIAIPMKILNFLSKILDIYKISADTDKVACFET